MALKVVHSRNPSSARSITAQIRRLIETGELSDGDQLPPERELSENYSASRSTVRKALEDLEADGLVTRQVGSGTFITYSGSDEMDLENVAEQLSPLQLIDVRIGFERQMTRLAVVHATGRDVETLTGILNQMEACETDKVEFTRLDTEYHLALARASGNPLIVQLYNQINEVRGHSQWQAAREIVLTPGKIRDYNKHHRGILDALRRRDAVAAIEALNAHMDLAQQDLLGTVEQSLES